MYVLSHYTKSLRCNIHRKEYLKRVVSVEIMIIWDLDISFLIRVYDFFGSPKKFCHSVTEFQYRNK